MRGKRWRDGFAHVWGLKSFEGSPPAPSTALGMSIIGKAEGKSPTLARVAEDNRALLDLLKQNRG